MCGIIAAVNYGQNQVNANEAIVNQFEDQCERGEKGFGIICLDAKRVPTVYRATEKVKFLLDLYLRPSQIIIAHHRMPTSSENKLSQTHPIVTTRPNWQHLYYTIHNGVISNDDELKKAHEQAGFKYTTEYVKWKDTVAFNDTEAVAIEFARYLEGETKAITLGGSAALVILQVDKKTNTATKLFAWRNSNPLHLAATRGKIFLSSTGPGDNIAEDVLFTLDLSKLKQDNLKFQKKALTVIKPPAIEIVTTKARPAYQNFEGYNTDHFNHRIQSVLPVVDVKEDKDLPPGDYKDEEEVEENIFNLDAKVTAFLDSVQNREGTVGALMQTLDDNCKWERGQCHDLVDEIFNELIDPRSLTDLNYDMVDDKLQQLWTFVLDGATEVADGLEGAAQAELDMAEEELPTKFFG